MSRKSKKSFRGKKEKKTYVFSYSQLIDEKLNAATAQLHSRRSRQMLAGWTSQRMASFNRLLDLLTGQSIITFDFDSLATEQWR